MSSPVLSRRAARYSMLALALAACGAETKPTAADAKSPDKAAAPPTAAKTDANKPDANKPDPLVKKIDGADPTHDRYALRIDAAAAAAG